MIYEHLFERAGDKRVRAGLIGAGAYGTPLLAQARSISRIEEPPMSRLWALRREQDRVFQIAQGDWIAKNLRR